MTIRIKELNIYPIKSTKGISLNQAVVTERGLEHDRLYMIADDQKKFLSQRQLEQMATISTTIRNNGSLEISAPGKQSITISPDQLETSIKDVQQRKETLKVHMAPQDLSDWISDFLGQTVSLARISDAHPRTLHSDFNPQPSDHTGFPDRSPILIANTASLQSLQTHFETGSNITIDRFRANIVLDSNEVFAEDMWHHIKIGDVELELVGPCSRCVMTTIDQKTGQKTGSKEPLATLRQQRFGKGGVFFGEHSIPRKLGTIRVGDEVRILDRKPLNDALKPSKINGSLGLKI